MFAAAIDGAAGDVQACFVDFGCAAQYGGDCILRFDDTNPEAEKQEFIDHIQDIVAWLGWSPAQASTPPPPPPPPPGPRPAPHPHL